MTTKELIQQYVTAHADNRWMDASELEALLTEFAEKLKEPASEDLERCVVEQMEADGDVDDFVRRHIDDIASKYAQLGAQWQKERDQKELQIAEEHGILTGMNMEREQMMKDAIHCKVFWHDGPLLDYTQEQQDDVLEKIGAEVGDKVKLIIVKDND